jgi:MerR family transcriptional regulator, Zn(II)-responsive regulator of zntA
MKVITRKRSVSTEKPLTMATWHAAAPVRTKSPSRAALKPLPLPPPSATVVATARAGGVAPHVVRYYARVGLLKPRRDPHNGYQLFDGDDVKRLRFVRQAQSLGFTLAEIRKILRDADRGETPCPRVRDIVRRRIEENRREIRARERLQRRLEGALEAWSRMPDGFPDGDSVCHLIESVGDERN